MCLLRETCNPWPQACSAATALLAGAATTAALGVALHFAIVTAMALVYYATASQACAGSAPAGVGLGLRPHLVWGDDLRGGALVRRTAIAKGLLWVALSILAHVALVGIPIAFGTHLSLRAPIPQ